jgi:hypothetical protein
MNETSATNKTAAMNETAATNEILVTNETAATNLTPILPLQQDSTIQTNFFELTIQTFIRNRKKSNQK